MSTDSADTVDDLQLPRAEPVAPDAPFVVDVAGRSHPGKVRPTNEDHFHVVQFGRYLATVESSLPFAEAPEELDRRGYGLVVADGIGGRAGGEVASRLAIRLLIEFVLRTPDWILGQEDEHLGRVMDRFAERFRAINETVMAHARAQPELSGMGTTLSLAVNLGADLLVAHLGDSRVYLLRDGRLQRLTRDHTVARLREDPAGIRFIRVLTHAIGIHTGSEPALYHYKLADKDRLLLCTDGLSDMVDDVAIAAELGRGASAADTCQALVDLALARGGRDNVTVVVASYQFAFDPAPPGEAD